MPPLPQVTLPAYLICNSDGVPGVWEVEGHECLLLFAQIDHAELRIEQMGDGWGILRVERDDLCEIVSQISGDGSMHFCYMTSPNPKTFLLVPFSQFVGDGE